MEPNGSFSMVDPAPPNGGGGVQHEQQTSGRVYEEEVHLIRVPKPLEGERLGLTVQEENGCVVVTRVLSGGLVDQVGHIAVGNIVLEINNIPVHSADDLMALVAMADKSMTFLVKQV